MSRCEECGGSGSNCDCANRAAELARKGLVKLTDLVGIYEASTILQLTETRLRQLRREGLFVKPVRILKQGEVYAIPDLLAWQRTRVKKVSGRPPGKRKVVIVDEEELL